MNLLSSRKLLAVAALALASLIPRAQAASLLYDFNTPGSLSGDFNLLNDTNGYWSQPATGGLSNTGNIAIGNSGTANTKTSALVAKEGFAASETAFTLSVFFQMRDASSNGHQWMIGVLPTATTAPSVAAADATVQLAVGMNKGSSGYRWAEFNNTSVSGKNASDPGGFFQLTAGSWYYFEANFARTDSLWTIEYSIYLANADGTLPDGSLVSTITSTLTNATVFAGDELYPFIAVANSPSARMINRFDNFSAPIPEPGVLPGTAVSALVLLGLRRWTRRLHSARS